MNQGLFDSLPMWLVFTGTITLVLLAIWLGNRVGRHASSGVSDEAPVNAVTGAHLGLLAFFLAFSFNMASGHFDTRRKLILEEVNAVGNAYFAADLIEDAHSREVIRGLLRDYIGIRADLNPDSDIPAVIQASESIQAQIGGIMAAHAQGRGLTSAESIFVRSLSEVTSYHNRRVSAAFQNRIPRSIWPSLYGILIFSMVGLGYTFGLKGSRNHVGSLALALSFSMVIYLTADLDRPAAGVVVADQSAFKHLQSRVAQ